jgi:hypothetical protein
MQTWKLIVALALGLACVEAPASAGGPDEPLQLTGTWAGTWWMGKYEQPAELNLVQAGGRLTGTVVLEGVPVTESHAAAAAPVSVTGEVDGDRARLRWTVTGSLPFTAELSLSPAGVLMGLGGDARGLTTGFTLTRAR